MTRPSSNGGALPQGGDVCEATRAQEMACFDAMPPVVRQALRGAAFNFSAADYYDRGLHRAAPATQAKAAAIIAEASRRAWVRVMTETFGEVP